MKTQALISKLCRYKELQAKIKEAEKEADAIKEALQKHMGERDELSAGAFNITWRTGKRQGFDTASLKEAEPETYAKYYRETPVRSFRVSS